MAGGNELAVQQPQGTEGSSQERLAKRIAAMAKALQARKLTLATAESCTAGRFAAMLSEAPGASMILAGGLVTYTKAAKTRLLGVAEDLLAAPLGAVSGRVAEAMAEGALERSGADFAMAITGVAGPDRDEDGNPVGRVVVALAQNGSESRHRCLEYGFCDRDTICTKAMADALELLERQLALGRPGTA